MRGSPPEHLVPIGNGDFAIWRSFCVRRAGMPYDWIETAPPDDFSAANAAALAGLRRIIDEPLFREAVRWQNLRVATQLQQERRGDYKRSRRALLRTLAGYAQRYCAKNDSIGFFGPKSWGAWIDGDIKIDEVEQPPQRGPVFLELWAVRSLADALEERHVLWPWTVPHVAPGGAIAESEAYLFDGSRLSLTGQQRSILEACDGFRTVAEVIADRAAAGLSAGVVEAEIRKLQAMGVLSRGFTVSQSRHPERQLRMQLFRIGNEALRDAAREDVDDLVAAVAEVSAALGDPPGQDSALTRLDGVFSRVTGQAPRRNEGQYYAGRNIAFEDCVSLRETSLSMSVLRDVAPALDLLLTSARWFSCAVADAYLEYARCIMAEDPNRLANGYPLALLLSRLADTFWNSPASPAAAAAAQLRARWTSILAPGDVRGHRLVSAAEIGAEVALRFAARSPGWPAARWHSPDLMLAATSIDDIRAGRYVAVLGELHPTINSMDSVEYMSTHPDQSAARRWIDSDMPCRIVPLYPLSSGYVNSRTGPPEWYHAASYSYLGVGTEPPYQPTSAKLVPVGTLTVHAAGGGLVVRSSTDGFEADLAAVLDDYLGIAACNRFGLLEPRAYQPRISIDKMVVARETWRVPFDQIPSYQGELEHIFAIGRRLREDHGLPRITYARISGELKPVFLDFHNPLAADVFFSKLRRGRDREPAGEVVFTEMFPGPDELWLKDALGRRYTAEFRFVCLDRARYCASSNAG
jgi:Lantibiotic dehydratase, N terminus